MKTIPIGSDHAGYEYKEKLIQHLKEQGYSVKDYGTNSADSVDYPDFAHPVAVDVARETAVKGIVMCGSGNGVAMSVNKHAGIRAALCWNKEITVLARQHNNANILSLPARYIALQQALEMVDVFLKTPFAGGRHERRIEKIPCN